jgi:GntR family transcriptional regulator
MKDEMPRRHATPPAYVRLAEDLRVAIRSGTYSPSLQLPTESMLAAEYEVSRQTVRRAYLELVAEGLVDRIPGRGTFVATQPSRYLRQFGTVEDLMSLASDTRVNLIRPLQRHVHIEASARLGLADDAVYSLEYIRLHDQVPFAWTTVFLPPLVAELVEVRPEFTVPGEYAFTVLGLLDGLLEDPVSEARQTITATTAGEAVAEKLGCVASAPVLRIDRLFLDSGERAVELSIGHFLPQQYTYRTVLRRA